MAKTDKSVWLQHGYDLFAESGPTGLKVEVLARNVGKSKSSFYHHFSDVEGFVTLLLKMHISRANTLAERLQQAGTQEADLVLLFVEFKADIIFQRQLRVHRHLPDFLTCFTEAQTAIESPMVTVLADALELSDSKPAVRTLFQFALENFLMRITSAHFTEAWLTAYFQEFHQLLKTARHFPLGQ